MHTVHCSFSGKQVKMDPLPRVRKAGDVYYCRNCKGDVTLDADDDLHHEDGAWLTCPVNDETVFVFTDEDAEFWCTECNGTITVSDGEAEHEDLLEVECPWSRGDTTLVSLEDEGEYQCEHCDASIYSEKHEAWHEELVEIKCPRSSGETTLVSLDDEGEYNCDNCDESIYSEGRAAWHEKLVEIRCPLSSGETTLVSLDDEGEYNCDHCNETIYSEYGAAWHEDVPTCRRPYVVFVSYAHKDQQWLEPLQDHLSPLVSGGLIELWDDTKIPLGDEWLPTIETALERADIAVLLVTEPFMESTFIQTREVPALLEKRAESDQRRMRIIPLLIGKSTFEDHPICSKFQAVKMTASNATQTLLHLAREIAAAAKDRSTDFVQVQSR